MAIEGPRGASEVPDSTAVVMVLTKSGATSSKPVAPDRMRESRPSPQPSPRGAGRGGFELLRGHVCRVFALVVDHRTVRGHATGSGHDFHRQSRVVRLLAGIQ